MFKSIRWSLLFWYALILVVVLGAFGATLYLTLRHSALKEIDSRLRAHAKAFAGATEWETKGSGKGELENELSDEYLASFNKGKYEPYYIIWDPKGAIVDRSPAYVESPRPEEAGIRDRDGRHEVVVEGRGGHMILVGQWTKEVLKHYVRVLRVIVAYGCIILMLALLGGWFLVSRALGPIRRISETASSISASNLSERIDVARTENELGELAKTLNSAFGRLEAAFERQTRFTADASHELRTPLSIVLSHSELALKKERSPEEYREALQTCLKASQRMKGVVESLLTLARADAGELPLKREKVDFAKLVGETAASLKPLALERNVAISTETQDAEVAGDADHLRDVVTNLVTNAIRYNRDGGRVDVSLKAEEGKAVLRVADTGQGIPEKYREHIFERFYRVDKARSREVGGSGLGLAITKWIVEAHEGTISFTSREGEGATFTVVLPVSPNP